VSVLVNGSPTYEFIPEKGLRQGDLMTSFLFLIAMEGLSSAMREDEKRGLLEGLKICSKQVPISMLQFQFVDDTIFMCNDNVQNIVTIKSTFRCFQLASGLKVNLHKIFIRE